MLVQRKIVPIRYVDELALTALGLVDDVAWMFEQLSWTYFMSLKCSTFANITLEFFSSLEVVVVREEDWETGRIAFRLFNNDHVMNLSEFCAVYYCLMNVKGI